MSLRFSVSVLASLAAFFVTVAEARALDKLASYGPPLPGSDRLTLDGDPALMMIARVDRFLLRELEASIAARPAKWTRDVSSAADYEKSVEPNRRHLSQIIGLRNGRGEFARVQLLYENLGISQRTRMTYYVSYQSNLPYADRETFEFLHEYLRWPRPAEVGNGTQR
jgi:hypothetical protein